MSAAKHGVESIGHYERRRKCWLPSCRSPKGEIPFCDEHTEQLPDDLIERIRWAYDGGDTMDWLAAIQAAITYLREP